jgi:hypothetical protein
MKKKTKEKVHAMMAHLLTKGPRYLNTGICNNAYGDIKELSEEQAQEVRGLMKLWPEYSGNPSFPVPSCSTPQTAPDITYFTRNNMWDRESNYGRARWRLVQWLHEQTK